MITLEQLTLGYDRRTLLRDVSCTLEAGHLTALTGRNGTGKSTLLRAIAGLNRRYTGRILLNGHDARSLMPEQTARTLAFVNTERVRVTNMRCRDAVALGRAPYTGWTGRLSEADRDAISRALARTGMTDYADRKLDTLSDGECQRVMIARALAQDTPIILLDEPTSFLDLPNRYDLCSLLQRLAHDEGKCILFSTHELDIALRLADDIMLLDPPGLHLMPAPQMRRSDILRRLFGPATPQ